MLIYTILLKNVLTIGLCLRSLQISEKYTLPVDKMARFFKKSKKG